MSAGVVRSGRGGHVDDHAAPLSHHVGQCGLRAQKRARKVHRHHAIPRFFAGLQRGAVSQDPGAVEEDVQVAVLADRALYHLAHLPRLRYIKLREQGFPARGANLLNRFHPAPLAGIGNHHGRTLPGKADGHRPGNAGSSAGNQRDLGGKPHIILLFGPGKGRPVENGPCSYTNRAVGYKESTQECWETPVGGGACFPIVVLQQNFPQSQETGANFDR